MKKKWLTYINNHMNPYRIGILLSLFSVVLGLFREFLIVGLLGFTVHNDRLQLYLSIFYTIGLSIDAMRLSCLNLYSTTSLLRIIISASVVSLPFSIMIGLIMSYSTGGLNLIFLGITLLGSYFNLIVALLITYYQRNNSYLFAQLISVIPNFILIPGILICWVLKLNLIYSIVCLTSLIPIAQCIMILFMPKQLPPSIPKPTVSLLSSIITFVRHLGAMTGEQLFQIIIRTAFYDYGPGYLSVYAMTIRIYASIRFILIDSFIGSKLANWKKEITHNTRSLSQKIPYNLLPLLIVIISLGISLKTNNDLVYASAQMIAILIFGFYLSTLVRIIYFKINHIENNVSLVMRFAMYEFICATCAFALTKQLHNPILAMLWLGYVAKPFAQLHLVRKQYHKLEVS